MPPQSWCLVLPSSWPPPPACLKVGGTGQGCVPLLASLQSEHHEGKTPVGHVSGALCHQGSAQRKDTARARREVGLEWGWIRGQAATDQALNLGRQGWGLATAALASRTCLPPTPVSPGQVGRVSLCSAVAGCLFLSFNGNRG